MTDKAITLPDITISIERLEQFKSDLEMLDKIANQFGGDVSHLFAEICLIYDIMSPEALENEAKRLIRGYCLSIMGNLNHAMEEVKHLRSNVTYEEMIMQGHEYFQIYGMLRNLRSEYVSILGLINEKKYFTKEMLDSVMERLRFLYDIEFEELKGRFKVVEALRAASEAFGTIESPSIIH